MLMVSAIYNLIQFSEKKKNGNSIYKEVINIAKPLNARTQYIKLVHKTCDIWFGLIETTITCILE